MAEAGSSRAGELGAGLSVQPVEVGRYDGQSNEPWESSGLLMAATPKGARILDVGCGTGSVSTFVRDASGGVVVGIEPSPERAETARSRGFQVWTGTFPHPDVPPKNDFDVVLFADVLEHLVDPGAALLAAKGHLKPGGVVLASVPNVAHWMVRGRILRGRWDYEPSGIMDATHLRWFTRVSLLRLFTGNGFHVECCQPSAGTDLPVYAHGWPWRWLGRRTRDRLIRRGVRYWPTLFGCQWIVRARPQEAQ